MIATEPYVAPATPATLEQLALAELAARLVETGLDSAEIDPWRPLAETLHPSRAHLDHALASPDPADTRQAKLGRLLRLSRAELLAVSLAASVERDLLVGRALSFLQAPVGGSRPTVGLLAELYGHYDDALEPAVDRLAAGPGVVSGLLVLGEVGAPVPERPAAVPAHLLRAMAGRDGIRSGTALGTAPGPGAAAALPLPPSILATAARHAGGLATDTGRVLVVRSGSEAEGRAVAQAVAHAMGRRPLFIHNDDVAGITPWVYLSNLVPVFVRRMGPSERARLPALHLYDGPMLVVCGPDGSVVREGGTALNWTVPVPPANERASLWSQALGDSELATSLGQHLRHRCGRIAELGRLARHRASTRGVVSPESDDVVSVAREGDAGGLDALAQPLRTRIPNEALVLPPNLARDLETLLLRCLHRESLANGLGISAVTRYRAGVRSLLVGASGTGKTLAAGWLATKLDLPLYRVDMASIVSKYIGETEKNLAQLLSQAEYSEVVLLFDEADSLFGKRTDVKQANDRFANAQTNYLLQRIETYDGITILTSNSRSRFDPAFTRRLDMIIEFPLPGPNERHNLWRAHLGNGHDLEPRAINMLASLTDLAGGHIRNVVLAAAVHARQADRIITWKDILRALSVEYRKLGRQVPPGLRETT